MSMHDFRFCEIQAFVFLLPTNSEERIPGISNFLKLKMPCFRCCELLANTTWFPTHSEKQFLGFTILIDHIDARYSLLWTPCYALPHSALFRETVSGHFEILNHCRCPFFAAVNAPLPPSDFSQFQRTDFWASQTEKSISMPGFHSCEYLAAASRFLTFRQVQSKEFWALKARKSKSMPGSHCLDFTAVNTPWDLLLCKVSVIEECYLTGAQIRKTPPRLCGTASFRSCWVLHSTGGMSVKGGVSRRSGPLTDNSVLC